MNLLVWVVRHHGSFAVTMGAKDKAICTWLRHSRIWITFLRKQMDMYWRDHTAAISSGRWLNQKYNERFSECERALELLKKELKIDNLCEIDLRYIQSYRHLIADDILQKERCMSYRKNARVRSQGSTQARALFSLASWCMHLMNRSESCMKSVEKNWIPSSGFCQSFKGCIGARMTGAGFGGCAIALVKKNSSMSFLQKLNIRYRPGSVISRRYLRLKLEME